jgi:hypothetical protein
VTYKYLYQDRENRNCEGEIKARDRAEAYMLLRKQGIRPYRVIGDDPFHWQPWAFSLGYVVLLAVIVALVMMLAGGKPSAAPNDKPPMTEEEARVFREKAEEAVIRAPDAFKYNVWKGVNARLVERGLEPIERPEGLVDE